MSVLKCVRTFTQLTIYDKMIILKIKFIYLNKSRNIPRSLYFFTNIVVLFIYYNNDREVKEMYLLNAFSLQMVDIPCVCKFSEVEKLPEGLKSAVGHPDTAAVLGVTMNRINVKLNRGDVAYIAQLQGGRLPEGSTTLPEGFSFKYIRVDVE